MARAFTAVSIEDEDVVEELISVQEQIDLGFNLVEPEKLHITFEFFEDATEEDIENIKGAMDKVKLDSFELEIEGLGAFPSEDYIRVVWAGAENSEMHELYRQLTKHEAVPSTENNFKPHVTLARVDNISKEKKRKLQRMLKEFSDHQFGTITVDEIKLYRSDLKPHGAVYKELYSVEL